MVNKINLYLGKNIHGKYTKKPSLLACMILLLLIFVTISGYAWDTCHFGLVDDPYPGECNRHVDLDNDNICDLSQSSSEDRENLASSNSGIINDNTREESKQHEEKFSVKIEGKKLKIMKIANIALMWGIEAYDLLNETVNQYNLENNYNINHSIDDLRLENNFPPSQIKEIAENIKLKNDSPKEIAIPGLILKAKVVPFNVSTQPSSKKVSLSDYNF